MSKALIAIGLILSISVLSSGQVQASPFSIQQDNILQIIKPVIVKPKPIKKITIKQGDTLNSLAKKYKVSANRLYAKNKSITNPDVLQVGQVIIVPEATERLSKRVYTQPRVITDSKAKITHSAPTSENSYSFGYCTWFIKSVRPDIPNNWGNADSWFYNAQAQGWATTDTAQVGAVAAARSYMHVALVIAVDGDRVQVREMNYNGWNIISTRWSSNSEWHYIL